MDKIVILKGPERVRRRPAVLFGDDGMEGLCCALEEFWNVLLEDNVRRMTLRYTDGVLEMGNDGQGLYLSKWEEMFLDFSGDDVVWKQELWSPFTPDLRTPLRQYDSVSYDEYTLYALACVSTFLDVESVRDGKKYSLHFEKGINKDGLQTEDFDGPSGTRLVFKPDPTVFVGIGLTEAAAQIPLPEGFLKTLARRTAFLHPNVTVELTENGNTETFCYKNGLQSAMEEATGQTDVFTARGEARGKDRYNYATYGTSVRVAIAFCKNKGFIKAYHNNKPIQGGRHVDALLREIDFALSARAGVTHQQVEKHLCLVVQTTTTRYATRWDGGRRFIANQVTADLAEDIIKDDFLYYCSQRETELALLYRENQ